MRYFLSFIFGVVLLCGCSRSEDRYQGYAEGEFVYVSPVHAGQLLELAVKRGDQVAAGTLLYKLDSAAEEAALNQARQRLQQAQATLADQTKGKRPSEIESLKAQLHQAETGLELAEKMLKRNKGLLDTKAVSQQTYDQALSERDRSFQLVVQLKSDLQTAGLGAREDQQRAAEEEVKARQAELDRAHWDLDQKQAAAPAAALVFDTLFRQGEFVPAGQPVVSLLPPANIKVRTFVPEPVLAAIKVGQKASIFADGSDAVLAGAISYISPRAEYTPPVIYSRESRSKLVFMVELSFDGTTATQLHPGQPVEVRFE